MLVHKLLPGIYILVLIFQCRCIQGTAEQLSFKEIYSNPQIHDENGKITKRSISISASSQVGSLVSFIRNQLVHLSYEQQCSLVAELVQQLQNLNMAVCISRTAIHENTAAVTHQEVTNEHQRLVSALALENRPIRISQPSITTVYRPFISENIQQAERIDVRPSVHTERVYTAVRPSVQRTENVYGFVRPSVQHLENFYASVRPSVQHTENLYASVRPSVQHTENLYASVRPSVQHTENLYASVRPSIQHTENLYASVRPSAYAYNNYVNGASAVSFPVSVQPDVPYIVQPGIIYIPGKGNVAYKLYIIGELTGQGDLNQLTVYPQSLFLQGIIHIPSLNFISKPFSLMGVISGSRLQINMSKLVVIIMRVLSVQLSQIFKQNAVGWQVVSQGPRMHFLAENSSRLPGLAQSTISGSVGSFSAYQHSARKAAAMRESAQSHISRNSGQGSFTASSASSATAENNYAATNLGRSSIVDGFGDLRVAV